MVDDQASDSLFQRHFTKIDQQSDGDMQQPQIGQNLFCMNWVQLFDRFYFDDKPIFDQQIDARNFAKFDTVKNDIDRPLSINFIPHHRQSTRQQRLIDAFQQAGSDFAVQPHGNANQIVRDLMDMRSHFLCDLCVLCAEYFKNF